MTLELDENTFDKNYTNENAIFTLRLAKYLPTRNKEQLTLEEHRDYLRSTLIQMIMYQVYRRGKLLLLLGQNEKSSVSS